MDTVPDLASHHVDWPECGELQSVNVEPMDRVQAEEGGKTFIARVRDQGPSRLIGRLGHLF